MNNETRGTDQIWNIIAGAIIILLMGFPFIILFVDWLRGVFN